MRRVRVSSVRVPPELPHERFGFSNSGSHKPRRFFSDVIAPAICILCVRSKCVHLQQPVDAGHAARSFYAACQWHCPWPHLSIQFTRKCQLSLHHARSVRRVFFRYAINFRNLSKHAPRQSSNRVPATSTPDALANASVKLRSRFQSNQATRMLLALSRDLHAWTATK